jgi:hypothetical protein
MLLSHNSPVSPVHMTGGRSLGSNSTTFEPGKGWDNGHTIVTCWRYAPLIMSKEASESQFMVAPVVGSVSMATSVTW